MTHLNYHFGCCSPLAGASFTAADAAFLSAMAMRPCLPSHNICWDDHVGDHNLITNWHAQAWHIYSQATPAAAAAPEQPPEADR